MAATDFVPNDCLLTCFLCWECGKDGRDAGDAQHGGVSLKAACNARALLFELRCSDAGLLEDFFAAGRVCIQA